jgi:hypothetical protein
LFSGAQAPSAADLADQAESLGIDLSEYEETVCPDFDVWPENQTAAMVFSCCMTQWRTGSFGVVGLDYGVVFHVMKLYSVEEELELLADVQVMELRAMEILRDRAKAETR